MDIRSTVRLHTGRRMPIIGLGTWKLTDKTAEMVAEALKQGYPMLDTSRDYGTQPGVGQGIRRSGKARSSIYIIAKVEEDEDAYEATKKNLEGLQLERADLMLLHRPPKHGAGEELWRGLMRARDEGLTTDIGVSNYNEEQIEDLIDSTGETPVVNQIEWSPFGWSEDMLEFCHSKGIVIQAYSPLSHSKRLRNETVAEIAEAHGKSPAQILLRWSLQKGIVPIPKANKPEHARQNINLFDFELTDEDMETLDNLNEAYSALGPKPAYAHSRR